MNNIVNQYCIHTFWFSERAEKSDCRYQVILAGRLDWDEQEYFW